jgi:DNA-directed RNA polymerase
MDLPEKAFRSLLSSDTLYITDEQIVVDLIVKYLKNRDMLPILDEDNPMKNWTNLTEEERKKREEEEAKAKEEETKKKEEEEKKDADEFAKLDDLGKIQHTWNKKVQEIHDAATDALALKRLNREQRKELFKCIRYSYLHHEKLLALTADPLFELAKNFIVEGLTHKLGAKDGAPINQKLEININPRVYYDERMIVGAPQQPGAAGEVKVNPKLQSVFDQAIQQRKSMPVAMNINKLYRN